MKLLPACHTSPLDALTLCSILLIPDFKMRLLTCFTALALVGLLAASPVSKQEKLITQCCFAKDFDNYAEEHDVVVINSIDLNDIDILKPSDFKKRDIIYFFVVADRSHDQGLYVFKNGVAKKIVDNGIVSVVSQDDKKVFFGAKDGIYAYNRKTNSADKYGSVTENIVRIVMDKLGEVIYILTEDKVVYKVTDNGKKKEKLDDVVNAEEILVDFDNNLFFYSDGKVYVRTAHGVKKIEGLPDTIESIIFKIFPVIGQTTTLAILGDHVYMLFPNATSTYI